MMFYCESFTSFILLRQIYSSRFLPILCTHNFYNLGFHVQWILNIVKLIHLIIKIINNPTHTQMKVTTFCPSQTLVKVTETSSRFSCVCWVVSAMLMRLLCRLHSLPGLVRSFDNYFFSALKLYEI